MITLKAEHLLELARLAEILKQVPRTGWSISGVVAQRQESVAEHSFGTVFLCSILGSHILSQGVDLDLAKATAIAAIHDLTESLTSDIPKTAVLLGGEDMQKGRIAAEDSAMLRIREIGGEAAEGIATLWSELQKRQSIEARLVRGCDILDMLLHAIALEESGVDPLILDHFFRSSEHEIKGLDLALVHEFYVILEAEHRRKLNSTSQR